MNNMRKNFFILSLITLFLVGPAYAWLNMGATQSKRPSYFASAILSMNFEEGLNAYNSAGERVLFTSSGADIGAYGDGGGQALKYDDVDEEITYTQTGNQYLNSDVAQTICMKIKVSAPLDTGTRFFDFHYPTGTNFVQCRIQVAGDERLLCLYGAQMGVLDAYGDKVGTGTWEVIGYSWTIPGVSGDHASNSGDHNPPSWADGWDEDADEITQTMINDPTVLMVGGSTENEDPGDTESIIIDEWAIFAGYQVNCSDYMTGN